MAILKIKDKGVWKEIQAIKGDTGNGIQNIEKVSTVENVDTYAINYTDGTQTTFDVTNGEVTKEQLDEVDNRAKKTRNELERVKNDVLETGTATDTFVHLEDSAMAEYQELSIDGVCEQETTTGKNLLPNLIQTQTINGITITRNNDGSLKFNGTATAGINLNLTYASGSYLQLESGTTYTISLGNNDGIYLRLNKFSDNTRIQEINTPATTKTFTSNYTGDTYVFLAIVSGTTINNLVIYPMIEKSSTATSYEPYTGGQPSPNPDYPQEIKTIENNVNVKSIGKNLTKVNDFDVNVNNYYYQNNFILENFKNNTTYTLSFDVICSKEPFSMELGYGNDYYALSIYGSYLVNQYNGHKKITFTTNNNNYKNLFVRVPRFSTQETYTANVTNIMLVEEDTEQDYEPYKESSITANLPEGEFIGKISDTYKDTLKVEYNEDDGQHHLKLYKKIRKLSLAIADMNNSEDYPGWINQTQLVEDFPNQNTGLYRLCNYITNITGWSNSQNLGLSINTNTKGGTVWLQKSVFGLTQTQWKEKYPDLVLDLYYGLTTDTQYVVDLGIVDMPITYNGTTNLFTDSDLSLTINVKYYRNFISTVRNLQVNEKALKQELVDINTRLSALESSQTSVISESEVVE